MSLEVFTTLAQFSPERGLPDAGFRGAVSWQVDGVVRPKRRCAALHDRTTPSTVSPAPTKDTAMTTPLSIKLDGAGDIAPEDWQRIAKLVSDISTQIVHRMVNDSLRGVADAIARGVYESVIGQLDLETSTVIRDELGVIVGATKVTKRAA